MAESVLTNTNANFQAFQQATTYAQQRAQAAENARASIAALIPDAQAAANAKSDALIAAGAKADALIAAGAKTNAVAAAALLPDLRAARLAATATAGLIPHSGGDHTTIPAGAGVYRIMTDAEAGQVWERVAGGGVLRRPELEAAAATDVQEARALADSASNLAGDVQARVDAPPLSAPAQNRGAIYRGGVPYYPAPAGLTADGVTVISEAGGLYYRATNQVLPWEYNALPGTATTRTNSGAALQAWLDGQQRGGKPNLPAGFWYTDRMLELTQDDVTLDWRGALRPATGYTGYLMKIGDGVRTQHDLWGSFADGGQWQNPMQVPRIVVDGMHESRGVWLQNLDHYDVRLFAGRTRGAALLVDRCREGSIWPVIKHAEAAAQGEDINDPRVAVIRVLDQGDGDANNSMSFYDARVVYHIGQALTIDSPPYNRASPAPTYPNVARFIHFLGNTQFEALGYEYPFGTRGTLQPFGGRKIYIGDANAVVLEGQFSPGKLDANEQMIQVGDTGNNRVCTGFTLRGTAYGSSINPNGTALVYLDNVSGYSVHVERAQMQNGTVLKYGPNAAPTRYEDGNRYTLAQDAGYTIQGAPGIGRSGSIEYLGSNGAKKARQFMFDGGQFITQPDMSKNNLITLDGDARMFNQGPNDLQLGVTNLPVGQVCNRVRTASPTELPLGTTAVADGVNWDPLGRGSGPYMALWDGTMWRVP